MTFFPNAVPITSGLSPPSSIASCNSAETTASSARSSSSFGDSSASTMSAVSIQCVTYGCIVFRICPSCAFAAISKARSTRRLPKYFDRLTSTPYSSEDDAAS